MREFNKFITASQAELLIKSEFSAAMENSYVKTPKFLRRARKQKITIARSLKSEAASSRTELSSRARLFEELGSIKLEALDYSAKSVIMQGKLEDEGAIFGNSAINFCVTPFKLPKKTLKNIETVAREGLICLKECTPPTQDMTATEKYLSDISRKPNAARVDIVLTDEGPKIIEINTQWVDGIQILEGLKKVVLGNIDTSPTKLLSDQYRSRQKLGIIYINTASGSRSTGETKSLERMAERMKASDLFSYVEILDPEKYRSEYIKTFPSIYFDGDPSMIRGSEVPDWVKSVFNNTQITVFPSLNPRFDKKPVLTEAYLKRPDLFCPSYNFPEYDSLGIDLNTPSWVLKGDGFSSRQVAISNTEMFSNLWEDALMFPNEYILQPALTSSEVQPMFVFDTSSNKPALIKKPNSKFNVWIINNRVAGTMVSVSEEKIISDGDFNTIPIPC
ncbi:hypothetical protein ISR94_00495 [Candidatus Microgenomates bacterium]|nr:hypothetical protein [Candidatus Microgenomates bacterium]